MSRAPAPSRTVRVVRMGPVTARVLAWLERPVSDVFRARVHTGGTGQERLSALFEDPDAGPPGALPADEALDALVLSVEPGEWSLGIASFDLVTAEGESVFGRATVEGCCAVVSVRRLDPAAQGLPPNPERLRRRVVAEAVHELGHVAGLGHCDDAGCVMFASASLAETDHKGTSPCPRCGALLAARLGTR